MILRVSILLAALSVPMAGHSQVPPPPSLPGQDMLAQRLVRALETKDLKAYSLLLAEDLRVYDDSKEIARNKNEWLGQFGEKLVAEGVFFKISPRFSSTGRLLFIEYFNSTGSWGGDIPAHCCWSFDAVAYDIVDGKIAIIRRLRGGDKQLDELSSPPK